MTHEKNENRRYGIGASLAAGAVAALLLSSVHAGCGSDKATTGSAGTSGSAGTGSAGVTGAAGTGSAGDTGAAGTGSAGVTGAAGTGSAGSTGAAGTGGTACKDEEVNVTADITTNTTWPCNTYVLTKKIHITNGATLTIAAGSTIFGNGTTQNPAALISTREGKLVAVGTATAPIVFTSYAPVGGRAPGDTFAGVVMLGKAKLNTGTCSGDGDPATPACDAPGFLQSTIEGIDPTDPRAPFGGTDDTHNCGELKYVRIEFAGYVIGAGNELNGLSMGACGSQTKVSYIQVHRGFDDGIEMFGGTASLDHILISGSVDDGLDWDNGWTGKVQFLIIHQAYGQGDKGFEADNLAADELAVPRSNPEIWNATLIGETGRIGMHLRRGTHYKLRNFIVQGFTGGAVDVDAVKAGNSPMADWPTMMSIENSVFFNNPLAKTEVAGGVDGGVGTDNDMGFDEAAAIAEAARMNTTTADPMLGSVAIAAPNYVPANAAAVMGKATPAAPFDVTATYAGAVAPGTAPAAAWYAGWTSFPEK
jgi:hypothetical protein